MGKMGDIKDIKKEPTRNPEGTYVDLGEDLIGHTNISIPSSSTIPPDRRAIGDIEINSGADGQLVEDRDVPTLMENAKILFNEGLLDDAKKLLRKILILDPQNISAKKQLAEIQDRELSEMLREGEKGSTSGGRDPLESDLDSEEILKKLDFDLGLGVFTENQPEALVNQLSLFQNIEEMDAFYSTLERDLIDSSARDWIDLGIAFLEIDLYYIAIKLFTGACKSLKVDSEDFAEMAVSATSLLALTLYLGGRPYEAISKIQSMLIDIDIPREHKTELFYLLGRIYDSLKKPDLAKKLYLATKEIDPNYRDLQERLKRVL